MYRVEAFILALSQHYRILKEVTWDGKSKFNLIPDRDANIADKIESLIESVGGKGLANYCRLTFQKAWFSMDIKQYNIRKMLEYIRDHGEKGQFVDYLTKNFERLVEMAYRLSNPIAEKDTTKIPKPRKKISKIESQQMFLFSDMENKETSKDDKIEVEIGNAKKTRKPRKARKVDPNKPRRQRKTRRSRLDRLADEIIAAEYGNSQNNSSNEDGYDTYGDDTRVEADAFDHFSRGYGRLNEGDYGYFSGQDDY